MVAAALFAIGTESFLMRRSGAEAFRTMLDLKCLWSAAALVGLTVSLVRGAPLFTWVLLLTFAAFALVWNYYRLALRSARDGRPRPP
jgi:ABC-type amino acid transport system permease subunit